MATDNHDDLAEQRRQLLRELADIGDLRQGSLRAQYRKCGKPNCHCAGEGAQGHGPYWLLTWLDRDTGKSRGRTIPADAVDEKRLRSTRRVYGLPSYREREKKRLREQHFSTAAEVAEQLGLTPGTVRALGRAKNDSRIERGIITTEGRRYCMYRANCGSERFHQTPREEAGAAESASIIPRTEQGAS